MSLGAALFLAPGALAGGPTSVLIVSPESGETASLYYSDKEYEALTDLLGPGSSGDTDRPPSLDSVTGVRQINVTWMVHDISPWRLDRVHPSDDGSTVWIHSAVGLPTSYDGLWHKATEPAALTTLLKKLGVMGQRSGEHGGQGIPPQSSWEGGGATTEAAAPAARAAATGDRTDWWWAIPGLAAGTALGLALRPLAARLPRPPFGNRGEDRDPGPRRQLLDV
ncbi:hypothetical protein [Streptomyces sp. NPDC059909]|uniref:hypothetical protein n=1 Tax=Streptomyces sp. NPDC059909 TaxID=3346998 RepID=UPI00364C6C54